MKHVGIVTAIRGRAASDFTHEAMGCADAKGDFLNAIWRAWSDFVVAKKNEMAIP